MLRFLITCVADSRRGEEGKAKSAGTLHWDNVIPDLVLQIVIEEKTSFTLTLCLR